MPKNFLFGGSSWGYDCFVVGNKDSAGVKNLVKRGLLSRLSEKIT